MKLLDACVDLVNQRIIETQLTGNPFQTGNYYGLTYQATDPETKDIRPYYYENNIPKYIDLTDAVNAVMYHRCVSIAMTEPPNLGFGDDDDVAIQYGMFLVFYGKRANIGVSMEDMILKLSTALKYQFNNANLINSGLRAVRASVQRANSNSLQVFTGEYGATASCPLQFDSVYFGINYQIEILASNNCLTCSDC